MFAGGGKVHREKKWSMSKKAGLILPASRFTRLLKCGKYAKRISAGAGVYMGGVIEYLCAEVLELAGGAARTSSKKRITPRHIMHGIRMDQELGTLLKHVTIPQGGVMLAVHEALLKPRNTWTKLDTAVLPLITNADMKQHTVLEEAVIEPAEKFESAEDSTKASN